MPLVPIPPSYAFLLILSKSTSYVLLSECLHRPVSCICNSPPYAIRKSISSFDGSQVSTPFFFLKIKKKGIVHPITVREGPERK